MAGIGTGSSFQAKLRRTAVAYVFLAPAILLLAIFFVGPVFEGLRLSFFQYDPLTQTAQWKGLENYRRLLEDTTFRGALVNSFLYLLVVPVIISLSLGLAMLVEPMIPFVNVFRAAYYVPVVTTMVVVGITWRFIFNEDDGLLNTFLIKMGLIGTGIPWRTNAWLVLFTVMAITVWKGLGYYMVIFLASLKSIPVEVVEAGIVDGATPGQVFWRIKFPMLWPSISLVAVLSSISAMQVFDEVFVMTEGKIPEAITLVYYIYEMAFKNQDYGYASAMAVVLFLILFVFSVANLGFLRKGGYQGE